MSKIIIPCEDIENHINDSGKLVHFSAEVAGLSIEWNTHHRDEGIPGGEFEFSLHKDLELECPDYIEIEKYNELQTNYESVAYDLIDAKERIIKLEAELAGAQHRVQEQAATIIKYANIKLETTTKKKPFWKIWG